MLSTAAMILIVHLIWLLWRGMTDRTLVGLMIVTSGAIGLLMRAGGELMERASTSPLRWVTFGYATKKNPSDLGITGAARWATNRHVLEERTDVHEDGLDVFRGALVGLGLGGIRDFLQHVFFGIRAIGNCEDPNWPLFEVDFDALGQVVKA